MKYLDLTRFSSCEKIYKYLIHYKDDEYNIKSFCIILQKTSGYVKKYGDETK